MDKSICLEALAVVIAAPVSSESMSTVDVGDVSLPVEQSVKCLGIYFSSNQSSKTSIEVNLCKARRAFFAQGSIGIFHGLLNPLSSRSIFESCVVPSLLYESEVWLLNNTLLSKLESFQAVLGKRMLRLPKSTANSIPLLAMGLPSVRARIFISKLKFLYKIVHGEDNLASQAFRSFSVNDIEFMSIIRQCRFFGVCILFKPYVYCIKY